MQLVEHTSELSHYAYVVGFLCIVLGLMWGRFKAMHVFATPVLILIQSEFMGIKHIYATAVNPSILTVMALIALTGVLKKTLPFHRIIDLLGNSSRGVLIKSSLITATLSGFINNTPVVALLIPLLKSKAQENGWNVGRFLMPISFAAVAGGTITLIGTSTNLVLNGLMIENGIEGFKSWDFLTPGLTVTAAVLLTTLILAPIAAAMMQHYQLSHLEVFLPVAFGASGSFLTPSSYQTHLMVMGPGNYTNKDFMKLGLPVLIVYSTANILILL